VLARRSFVERTVASIVECCRLDPDYVGFPEHCEARIIGRRPG
jgi:hypothetical protein